MLARLGLDLRSDLLPSVASVEATCERLRIGRMSFSRFGDGELAIIDGRPIRFQAADPGLADRLRRVASSELDGHWVGLPDVFRSLRYLNIRSRYFWWRWRWHHLSRVLETFPPSREYGNAFVSRFYMDWVDKAGASKRLEDMRSIWGRRAVLVVEGTRTHFGHGNDLLANAESVRRVICPSTNAFDVYDRILAAVTEHGASRVILLALGPTATVLAHDLHLSGLQALDVGHLDIEYEWMRRGATTVRPVSGKAVAEADIDHPDALVPFDTGDICCVVSTDT